MAARMKATTAPGPDASKPTLRRLEPPTALQARQYALLLFAGVAPSEAIQLFLDVNDYKELLAGLEVWNKNREVRAARNDLRGGAWERKTTDAMIEAALEQHYRQLAFTLDNMHYFETSPQDRQKLDAARDALEKKQAGTAGAADGLTEFMNALRANKVKTIKAPPVLTIEH